MPAGSPELRVIVVDDEPPARRRLEGLLAREPDVALAGSYGDPRDAVDAIISTVPDLVVLDIQMPGMSGIDVVRMVGPDRMPLTIFVTAYDQYAVRAFEAAALDYLLKPFDDARFAQAIARVRTRLREREMGQLAKRLRALVDGEAGSQPAPPAPAPRYLERIAVDVRGRVLVVPVHTIDFISADGPYAELHVGGKRFVIRERTKLLEERLDPARFCRIHRSTIVNLDRVVALEPLVRGDYEVRLTDGTRLRLSRTWRDQLASRLGIKV